MTLEMLDLGQALCVFVGASVILVGDVLLSAASTAVSKGGALSADAKLQLLGRGAQ